MSEMQRDPVMGESATEVAGRCSRFAAPKSNTRDLRRRLATTCLATLLLTTCAATAAHDTPINADDPAYLRRQYAWFQSQDAARQQRLRKLHEEYVQQDADAQARLTRVMQRYNAWLAQLDAEPREQVLSAPTTQARLEIIRDLREREWVRTLPRPEREEYARLEGEARRQRVQEWRTEEAERREEWVVAQRQWAENPPGKVPAVFIKELQPQLETYVARLRENLSEAERKELDEARAAVDEGNFLWYALTLVRDTDRHPLIPYVKVGPKDFELLPEADKRYLVLNDPHFRKKGPMPAVDELKAVRRSQGRWPEFAMELAAYCQKKKLKLPEPLGACRKEEIPPEVRTFLDKTLEPKLRQSEAGKAELDSLNRAQGSWPEYPKMIMDLAKKYKLPVPGWTLPGPPGAWEHFRGAKAKALQP
jgi:hypothetical protein